MKNSEKFLKLIGYAGSGKTSRLLAGMERMLPELGGDPLALGFSSFTRAARIEAVGRAAAAWEVTPALLDTEGWFRTIHSTTLRCLQIDGGQLLTGCKGDIEWIAECLGSQIRTAFDDVTGTVKFAGDDQTAVALNCWNIARSRLLPVEAVHRAVAHTDPQTPSLDFIVRVCEHYESAKRLDERVDFCDLLLNFAGLRVDPTEGAYEAPPQGYVPDVAAWVFDEFQDVSPLLARVCERLISAETVRYVVIAGDPAQSIYGFAGSTASCLLEWPADKVEVMTKTWRCPRPILDVGEHCLSLLRSGRVERQIEPADHEGAAYRLRSIAEAAAAATPGDDWLLLARTNFQAKRLAAELHSLHKPFRWASVGDSGPTKKQLGLKALHTLAAGKPVKGEDFQTAVSLIPEKSATDRMLVRGTKKRWKNADVRGEYDAVFPSDLSDAGFSDGLLERLKDGSWPTLIDNGTEWAENVSRFGVDEATAPSLRVGTIHSAKGMEADSVAVLTTTSERIQTGMESPEQYDEEVRLSYVAATRAKRNLYIINEVGGNKCRMLGMD